MVLTESTGSDVVKVSHLHNWMQDLDEGLRAKIQNRMTLRNYDDGEVIYRQGDEGNHLYQIKSGRVKVCNYSADGKEILFGVLRSGDCFGEMSLIDQQSRFNYTIAFGKLELALLSRADFFNLYEQNPQVSQALNLMFSRRLRISSNGMLGLTLMGVRERLALTLLREGVADGEGNVSVDLSQEMLGKMLNAARQSVGKELKFFESQGWIQVQYGKILICDLEALSTNYESLLGQEPLLADYGRDSSQS